MTDLLVFNELRSSVHLLEKKGVCEGEILDLCNGMVVFCGTQ